MSLPMSYFDTLYAAAEDPWDYRRRWYEARKRALTLAALPHARYASAFEPGCAIGELSAALAERCDRLLISDGCAAAVALARQRFAESSGVQVEQRLLPEQWPEERFDLVVFSEWGYYLDGDSLARLLARMRESLQEDGVLLACHWRHPIDGCMLDGDAVHHLLDAHLDLPRLSSHREDDFLLDVWGGSGESVARREGLL